MELYGAPISFILAYMYCRFAMGVHRVVVLNELDAPLGVVSQGDVLAKQTEYASSMLGDNLRKSLASLGFLKPVLSVEKTELAINAFVKMHNSKVSALAVTENGRVSTTTSFLRFLTYIY